MNPFYHIEKSSKNGTKNRDDFQNSLAGNTLAF